MELFAVKIDGQDHCHVVENESMHIVGYLEQGEKGFYIHYLQDTSAVRFVWE